MPHGARRCQMHVRTNEVVNIADAIAAQRSLTAARAALEIALWVSTIAAWWCAVHLTAGSGQRTSVMCSEGRVISRSALVEAQSQWQRRLGTHPITITMMGANANGPIEFNDAGAVSCRYGATNGTVTCLPGGSRHLH